MLLVVAARLILHVGKQLRLAQPDGRYRPECTVYSCIRKIRIVANLLWTYSSKRDELYRFSVMVRVSKVSTVTFRVAVIVRFSFSDRDCTALPDLE